MIKTSVTKGIADHAILNKQYMFIIFVSSLVTLLLFGHMAISALAQRLDQAIPSTHSDIPQAKLIYNNNRYDMFPFVFINGGQLNKISFPGLPGDEVSSNTNVELKNGDLVSFQFSKQPIRVDAYMSDYDGDVPTLNLLKKVSLNSFKVEGIKGTLNLEVHAFFPDNEYTTYTLLVNVKGTNIDNQLSAGKQRQFATTKEDNISNIGQSTDVSQGCDKQVRLRIDGVSSSTVNKLNVPGSVLDNRMNTMWSVKGIDVMSFIQGLPHKEATSINENPWLQLDLGTNKVVCNIGLAFNNAENNVNFFTIQASSDGVHFNDLGTAQSSPIKTGGSLFVFPEMPYTTRYLRLTNLGNLVSGLTSSTELNSSISEQPSIAEFIAIGK
ncbi:MAG: discoidin domain-containing protein [Nitrososphaeraceae archaeon]